MQSPWLIQVGPRCIHTCPTRGLQRKIEEEREDGHSVMNTETGAMWLQAKDCQQPPEAGGGLAGSSPGASGRPAPLTP